MQVMAVRPAHDDSGPFVGRARELAIGRDVIAHDDQVGAILISGEAGLGKSRLVEHLIDAAGDPTVVRGVAVPRPTPVPFELIRSITRLEESSEGPAAQIRSHAEAARNLAEGPTIFVFEDVHWADAESLDVIDRLVATGPLTTSVLVTFRPTGLRSDGAASAFLRRTERRAHTVQLRLEPLRRDEVSEYLHASGRATSDDTVDHIHARTGGNPLLLAELVAATPPDADLTTGVPWTLAELLRPEIDALTPDVRVVAEAVAVLGSAIEFDLLAAAVEADERSLLQRLRTLVDLGILAEVEDDRFAFRHDLVREAVADSLFSRERRRLHGRVHDSLVATGSTDTVALVMHARAAGRPELAAEQACAGAVAALEAGHTHQAFAFADQALEERTDDVDLHRIAVVSGWMTGQTRAARSHLSRWDELIDADQEQRAELLHYKIRLLWESGDADADRAAEELAALADELPDSPARAQALADVAQHHMLVDRVRDAITVADRAVQVACDAGPEAASAQRQARVEGASARLAVASLREDAAIELSRLADEAERHGDYVTASRALHNRPLPADPDHALAQLDRMRDLSRLGGLATIGDVGHRYCLLTAAANAGDRDTYEPLLEAALEDFDDPYGLAMHATMLALGDGRLDDAEALINRSSPGVRSQHKSGRWREFAAALIDLERGRRDETAAWLAARVEDAELPYVIDRTIIGHLSRFLEAGLQTEIAAIIDTTIEKVEGDAKAAWSAARAEIAGDLEAAERLYREALESPFGRHAVERAELHLGLGRIASARGLDPRPHLEAAATALCRWPGRLRDRVDELLGTSMPAAVEHGLTPREREVASLVARGLTNGGIADELFISTKTASVHVSNILAKLGMHNRTEIAAWVAAGSMN